MATNDAYVQQRLGPMVEPGEQVLGTGVIGFQNRKATGGWERPHFCVATDRRLLLAEGEMGMLGPKPAERSITTLRYEDMAHASLGLMGVWGGRTLDLTPHQGRGPSAGAKLELFLPPASDALKMDGHAAFLAQFPDWLKAQLERGAFGGGQSAPVQPFAAVASGAAAFAGGPSARMGSKVRVGMSQRLSGTGVTMLLILLALASSAPTPDPAAQILLPVLGLAASLVGIGLFSWLWKSAEAPLGARGTFWFGAFTQYEHGTAKGFALIKNGGALLLPFVLLIGLRVMM